MVRKSTSFNKAADFENMHTKSYKHVLNVKKKKYVHVLLFTMG
jgi:hypothetical protein